MKKSLLGLCLSAMCLSQTATAQVTTAVSQFNLSGPYAVSAPLALDTVDVQGKKFDDTALLKGISLEAPVTTTFSGEVLPSLEKSRSVGLLSFYVNNRDFLKGKVKVSGPKHYKLYIDGAEAGEELKLAPEHHTFAIQYLAEPSDTDSIHVSFEAAMRVPYTLDKRHPYMVHDLTDGQRVRGISLSADGSLAVVSYQTTERGGNSCWNYELREIRTGRLVSQLPKRVEWMPRSVAYIEEQQEGSLYALYKVEPLTGRRSLFAKGLPEGDYTISPTEDYLIITAEEEGPKEDEEVFEVLEMDDRQPGWRKRSYLMKFDLTTGLCQRLTFGPHDTYLADISADGSRLLVQTSYSRLAKRPTEVGDFFLMDAATLHVDTLLTGEGFLGSGTFSPDGRQILFTGTPEAFGRIGCQLPAGVTPSMTENELFLYDIASRLITPLTKDFDPSVERVTWSQADALVYFSAEDRDYVNVFALNPKTGKISKVNIQGDYAYRFDVASQAPVLAYLSYQTMAPASAYVLNLKNHKSQTLFDGRTALGDAEIGTCEDWNFTNSKGDTVYGRLYLPKDFDATKQYPMIVYYYGGCSPVSRYFESPYAPQYWNSLGYVAYILQPSGATGFGQEWAARHVNTAGRGPAEDIIEGTKKICESHPFINPKKIGCMGASYGGFMTQYLQTQTDIFAAAVSHAGIANHTSYWGEGYWGYNYSEVSMANSYPWSHRQLYVDQSPLFNADKIHTPLLLLHGNADTNGWLKDDPTWWDALYPKKHL